MLLVGGMPRSGTTLLARIIAERFAVPFSPETHYFTYAYRNGRLAPEHLPKEVMEEPRVAAAYSRIGKLPRSVETFRTLLSEILGDEEIMGEKTPAHLMAFADILSQDDQVICVVILRDFFEIIESLKKVHWNKASYLMNLKRCARYHRTAFHTQRKFPDRVIVVDYRTLCENEQSVIAALSERLPRGAQRNAQQIFDPEREPWKKNALRAPEVIRRDVPLERAHKRLIAKLVRLACNIIWPLKTAHSK